MRIYLDMNIYNRHWDDQSQIRVHLETIAISFVLDRISKGKYELVWSFVLEYENSLNPFPERKVEIAELSTLAISTVGPDENIRNRAIELSTNHISPRDALHLACATKVKCQYFITCDDKLVRKMEVLEKGLSVMNPVDFIKKGVQNGRIK